MADSNLFKPRTSASGLGKKKMDDGQFANPPAYPEVAWEDDGSSIKPQTTYADNLQKTPSAKKGRV